MQKLQTVQNTALRIATGCTIDTNTDHLHQETKILSLKNHCKLHASNLEQKSASSSHSLNKLPNQPTNKTDRSKKPSLFLTNNYTYNLPVSNSLREEEITQNIKTNHSMAVAEYKNTRPDNKLLETPTPDIHSQK